MDYYWEEENEEGWQSDPNDETYVLVTDEESTEEEYLPYGEFYIDDWKDYPPNVPKPPGPFKILNGEDYIKARNAADSMNKKLRAKDPKGLKGKEIHEIHPVKFGGDPVDINNKIILDKEVHAIVTAFWSGKLADIKK